jgi:hypothetical protein
MVLSIYDEDQDKIQPLVWNGKEVKFTRDRDVLKIQRINGGELVSVDLRKYPYISRVFAIPIRIAGTGNQTLGVVARLRPTSGRAMFLVYDPEGKLVFQEFIECHGLKGFLSLVRDEAGKDYFLLNLEPPKMYTVR